MEEGFSLVNKRASFEYSFVEKFQAGMILTGTEIKSLRLGKVTMADAYCGFLGNELFLRNLHISEYKLGTHYNHEPKRERKLLLKKKEIKKLQTKVKEKGLTIIPIKIFFSETGYAKIEIALAKGKNTFDKRQSMKEKEGRRELRKGDD